MVNDKGRLVIVSNRLPVVLKKEGGCWKQSLPSAGGLVTALNPVLKSRGGAWIGWPGTTEKQDFTKLFRSLSKETGYSLHSVHLTPSEKKNYYDGFSNEIIWPLFHTFETRCNFNPKYWETYRKVNRKFAEAVAEYTTPDDYVWVQDYHLMEVGHYLKEMKEKRKLGFFLHIPFPAPDSFMKLPWREEVLHGLLEYDLIGVQTANDYCNLVEVLRRIAPNGLKISGRGSVREITIGNRSVRLGVFPISIDTKNFVDVAEQKEVTKRSASFHEEFPNQKIILGVDRLDYTKGIPEKIEAYWTALKKYPELRGKICLVQVAVPSRRGVKEYDDLKVRIEQLVSQVNGELGVPGWTPIHYYFRGLSSKQLIAYYRASEIAFVAPLRDGMNLVSKEYVICKLRGNGVLILSEFAGSAAELKNGAILVNPYDTNGMADAIYQAYTMPPQERKNRVKKMRSLITRNDIYHWVDSFLENAMFSTLEIEMQVEKMLPSIPVSNKIKL